MGNLITRSKASQPFEDKYVRVKSSNVSQNEMDMRLKHLRSMKYVTRSNRIITYSQINPYASNEEDASYQTRQATLSPTELVVTEAEIPPCQTPPTNVTNSSGDRRPLSELVMQGLLGTEAPLLKLPSELGDDAENAIEEQSCAICLHKIPLNFDSSESYVTTQCNHTFCRSCIQKVFDHAKHKDTCTIACPMCRAKINRDILYIKITPRTFVDNPDLSFIKDNHNRNMILEAYNTIHKNELWGKLRNLTPNEHEGFTFSKNPEIIKIMDLVNEKSTTGHSGLSMAITMRTIQQVARFGVDSLNTN